MAPTGTGSIHLRAGFLATVRNLTRAGHIRIVIGNTAGTLALSSATQYEGEHMLRFRSAVPAAFLCSAVLATFGAPKADAMGGLDSVQVGVHGGTLGVGVNAGFDVTDRVTARAMVNVLSLDYEETESDTEYKGDLDLQTIGLVGDWHPFGGGFRVTGGLFLNNNEVSATAQGEDVEINDNTYESAELDVLLDFESIAPYFGAGWTSGTSGDTGWSFAVDAGLLYQREPRLSFNGRLSGGCSFSVSTDGDATPTGCEDEPTLGDDLEAEHADLTGDLEDFKWYPVLAIGVSYRF